MRSTLPLVLLGATMLAAQEIPRPAVIAHRGLLRDAPENTLAAFRTCIELGLGFEIDIRRTRDGQVVILHDENVDRTTNGKGKIQDLTLAEVRRLDAGSWFDPAFRGQRVPTLEEVFALLKERESRIFVAADLKISDLDYEKQIVRLARSAGVVEQLLFIGRTISEPEVRKKLREHGATQICTLAQTVDDLESALGDESANWIYTRFVPDAKTAERIRSSGKKLFLSGPPVNKLEVDNFRRAREIRANALLTDFPLECRRVWRELMPAVPGDR